MPLPAGLETVVVTIDAPLYPNGELRRGQIKFQPSPKALVSATEDSILAGPVAVTFDGASADAQTVELLATDASGVLPTGWTYAVEERWSDSPSRSYSLSLPASAPTVNFADLVPTSPAAGELPTASSFGQELVASPDAPAARTALGLGAVRVVQADTTGATDTRAAIQAEIDAAFADGGGVVFLPPGIYRISSSPVVPKSRVSIIGAGIGRTILKPVGNFQAIYYHGTVSDVTEDVTFSDFEIDGSGHSNGGVYTSAMKGIQIDSGRRIVQRNLYVHHCGATGLGSDDLIDSLYENCIADNNGRLNDGTEPGGAGIGFAVGVHAVENTVFRNCITRGNGTHGIFFENQSGADSTGIQVVNHYASGNTNHGIADAGGSGIQVIGGVSTGNGKSGFAAYRGTYAGASGPGANGLVLGLDTNNNTENGVVIDATEAATNGWVIADVRAWGNTLHGILVDNGASAMANIHIRDCEAYDNQRNGICAQTSGGSITDLAIEGNHCRSNGRDSGGGTSGRHGIAILQSVAQLRIVNNRCWDSQSTKTQQYGLYMASGTHVGGVMEGNDFAQNAVASNVSIAATFSSYRIGFNNGHTIWTGSPEGVVSAGIGTLYRRLDGGAGTTLYVKESGTGSTGWVAK